MADRKYYHYNDGDAMLTYYRPDGEIAFTVLGIGFDWAQQIGEAVFKLEKEAEARGRNQLADEIMPILKRMGVL